MIRSFAKCSSKLAFSIVGHVSIHESKSASLARIWINLSCVYRPPPRSAVKGNGDTPIAIRDVLASALLEGGEPLLLQFRVGPCRTEYEALRAQNKPNTKQRAEATFRRSHLPTREVLASRN